MAAFAPATLPATLGAGKLTPAELQGVADKSCGVLMAMGPDIQWVHSYVTDDKIYCVYTAKDKKLVREDAKARRHPGESSVRSSIGDRPDDGKGVRESGGMSAALLSRVRG